MLLTPHLLRVFRQRSQHRKINEMSAKPMPSSSGWLKVVHYRNQASTSLQAKEKGHTWQNRPEWKNPPVKWPRLQRSLDSALWCFRVPLLCTACSQPKALQAVNTPVQEPLYPYRKCSHLSASPSATWLLATERAQLGVPWKHPTALHGMELVPMRIC